MAAAKSRLIYEGYIPYRSSYSTGSKRLSPETKICFRWSRVNGMKEDDEHATCVNVDGIDITVDEPYDVMVRKWKEYLRHERNETTRNVPEATDQGTSPPIGDSP